MRDPDKVPTEHTEQAKLVGRIRSFYRDVIVFAVPNGGLRNKAEAVRLKAEGVLAGVPDLVVAEPRGRYHGLYVEMKRRKGGRVSDDQLKIHRRLRRKGYKVLVGWGVDDVWDEVEEYLALPRSCALE